VDNVGQCIGHWKILYLETRGVRKEGKLKENGGAGYEASTCLMAQDVNE